METLIETLAQGSNIMSFKPSKQGVKATFLKVTPQKKVKVTEVIL